MGNHSNSKSMMKPMQTAFLGFVMFSRFNDGTA